MKTIWSQLDPSSLFWDPALAAPLAPGEGRVRQICTNEPRFGSKKIPTCTMFCAGLIFGQKVGYWGASQYRCSLWLKMWGFSWLKSSFFFGKRAKMLHGLARKIHQMVPGGPAAGRAGGSLPAAPGLQAGAWAEGPRGGGCGATTRKTGAFFGKNLH